MYPPNLLLYVQAVITLRSLMQRTSFLRSLYQNEMIIIYYTIHNLLEEGILELYEFERCPICSQEELIKINQSKSICSHCKDIFFSDFIIEKLKLSDRI